MRAVILYSVLLILGLVGSQILPGFIRGYDAARPGIQLLTMFCLSFIMIHVGYEFEVDKRNPRKYGWDYIVAATAAGFPWIFCALYFVFVLAPSGAWGSWDIWKESLLASRFAAPTSAGVLFSMLAAGGLSATWVFKKARVLAIFDDLDTVLLMIPLKILIVGFRWQLWVIIIVMLVLLWLAWKYLHAWRLPVSWPWVMFYSAVVTIASHAIYLASKHLPVAMAGVPFDEVVPIHIEVLLPAFVLGCMLARPAGHDPHVDDSRPGHQEGPEDASEQRISSGVSAIFMILVGLSLPLISLGSEGQGLDWSVIALHVVIVTLISNIGKIFPAFCYRKEAGWRDRLAVAVAMFPRGEVGAGVLAVSLSYGISGSPLTVAMLSLALNLVLTGLFIVIVKWLIIDLPEPAAVDG
jgi:Kef-type K+ transport system membrane component KefB